VLSVYQTGIFVPSKKPVDSGERNSSGSVF